MTSQLPIPHRTIQYIKQQDFPIEIICNDPIRGRYAIASRDIPENQVILRAACYGIATAQDCRREFCSACFSGYTLDPPLSFKCGVCSMVFYCSYKCQVGHFEFHSRFECSRLIEISNFPAGKAFEKAMAVIEKKVVKETLAAAAVSNATTTASPPPLQPAAINMNAYTRSDVQSFARWILNYCIRGELELKFSTVSADDAGIIHQLPVHQDVLELVPNLESLTFVEKHQLHGLYLFFGGLPKQRQQHGDKGEIMSSSFSTLFKSRFTSVEEFLTVMSIRQCNSFGLWDAESESLGQCLFPAASYFNHSCDKNLYFDMNMKVVESGRAVDVNVVESGIELLTLRNNDDGLNDGIENDGMESLFSALKLLPELVWRAKRDIKKGQVLTHSYIDTSMDRELRRKALRDGYHFDCDCDKCEAEANR